MSFFIRIVDPDYFNPDPDPVFLFLSGFRIQAKKDKKDLITNIS
jgi:hypothetical protein